LAGFVLGCAAQLQQSVLWASYFYMAFMLPSLYLTAQAAMLFIVPKRLAQLHGTPIRRATVRAGVCMLAALALGWGSTGLRAVVFQDQALPPALEGVDVQVVGTVTAMPQRSDAGLRFKLQVESAQRVVMPEPAADVALQTGSDATSASTAMANRPIAQPVTLPPQIYLSWYSALQRNEDPAAVPFATLQQGSADLRAGERWVLTVRLKAPHGNANPHGFDYELWLWEQGLQATGYVRATPREAASGTAPRKLGSTWQHPIERARQQVRDAIFNAVPDPRLAGVIAALVVGDQAAIERADWDVYRATGVAHLMSISGLHITMFAWAAALCVGALWRRLGHRGRAMHWLPAQHAALLGGVLLAALYALFSGWGVPSQRTIWMLATVALLRLSGKQWPWPLVWLLAMAVVVAIDPWALLQAGFWLSFVAVGVLFASAGQGWAKPLPNDNADQLGTDDARVPTRRSALQALRHHPVTRKLSSAAREQWLITLALAPLSLLLFQQVSLVGLIANAVAIPWVTLVVTPLAMLGVLAPPLWSAAAACVQLLGVVLAWFASWPFATVSIAAPAVITGGIAVLGGIFLAVQWPWPLRALGAVMVLPALLWHNPRPAAGQFDLLAADIGQGNAVLIRTAHHSLLYDTGPRFSRESDAGQRTLVPLLRALGEQLDIIIVSHRDSDHSGGALAVQAMQPQAAFFSSLEDGHEIIAARAASQTTQRCTAGQQWQWDGVDFQILHPQATDYNLQNKPNAMSCVLRISNGQRTALLVADIEAAQEARLIADHAPLQADILLAPHHGSKTSSTEAFLDTVKPKQAVFQSGYRNRYNHPAPEVAQRYVDRNIQLITSPQCGAAAWRSDRPDVVACQRQINRRYWQHQLP
jgi:competence protein ComEC